MQRTSYPIYNLWGQCLYASWLLFLQVSKYWILNILSIDLLIIYKYIDFVFIDCLFAIDNNIIEVVWFDLYKNCSVII